MEYLRLMRLNKPLPILLILWPTYWALWVANSGAPSVKILIVFSLGVVVTRSLGCVINDLLDRNIDNNVERTLNRPLVSKKISVKNALFLVYILTMLAFFLVLLLNFFTIVLSFFAIFLLSTYPLFKRFFPVPQLYLGVTFNFGIIMVFSASINSINFASFLLYFTSIIWTLSYDTIYAISDMPYDEKLGLNSSALYFKRYLFRFIITLQVLTCLLLLIFGIYSKYNLFYFLAIVSCILFFIYQYGLYSTKEINNCIKAFSNNHWIGLIIFIAIFLQYG